jgi:D-alanyl-lipoteichoic acid acyltransferase DltB (MBOAT superfamily)
MLFSEPLYFACFLPITVFLYWRSLHYQKYKLGTCVLVLASIVFYASWSIKFFSLLLLSAAVNYGISQQLMSEKLG